MNTRPAEFLAATIARLIAGEPMPPVASEDFDAIARQVGQFIRNGTNRDQEELGLRCLSLLIAASQARIATDRALHGMGGKL